MEDSVWFQGGYPKADPVLRLHIGREGEAPAEPFLCVFRLGGSLALPPDKMLLAKL